jgi:hypothetical protein
VSPGGTELDRQGQPVQSAAGTGDRGHVVLGEGARVEPRGPLHEQLHGRVGRVRAIRTGNGASARTDWASSARRSRLVASSVDAAAGSTSRSTSAASGSSRCSALSSTSRPRRSARPRRRFSTRSPPGVTPTAAPMVSTSRSAVTGTRSTHHTERPAAATRWASSRAVRVLPTPPGPVSVTSGRAASSAPTCSSSPVRPTRGDGGRGSDDPLAGLGATAGSSARRTRACTSRRPGDGSRPSSSRTWSRWRR